jgi:hypothetical protein
VVRLAARLPRSRRPARLVQVARASRLLLFTRFLPAPHVHQQPSLYPDVLTRSFVFTPHPTLVIRRCPLVVAYLLLEFHCISSTCIPAARSNELGEIAHPAVPYSVAQLANAEPSPTNTDCAALGVSRTEQDDASGRPGYTY